MPPAAPAKVIENLIEVRGLLSQFGNHVVHEGLDLTLERGEVLGVVGGSGTGKTVLLNSIIGLKEPEGGSVSILGHDRATMTGADEADVQRRTGILFQQGALFSSLSVIDNVASPLVEHTGLAGGVIRELAEMKIAMVGLKPEAHHLKPAELSGGMRKRVGLARALALEIAENTAPVSVALTRQMLWHMAGQDHPMKAHQIDSRAIQARGQSADAREGVSSFLEKRTPVYPNKVSTDMPDFFPWWDEPEFR